MNMLPVTKTMLPSLEDYVAYLKQIWQAGQLTNNGPLCRQLTYDIASYLRVSNLELVTNGTLALQLVIKALNLKGEIITTPYSYVATTNSILWEGCEPVFVDIEPQTFCINPDLIEAAITEKTSAILATHVYGYPCDVVRIQQIADKHKLKVIYDAAHAFGVRLAGRVDFAARGLQYLELPCHQVVSHRRGRRCGLQRCRSNQTCFSDEEVRSHRRR